MLVWCASLLTLTLSHHEQRIRYVIAVTTVSTVLDAHTWMALGNAEKLLWIVFQEHVHQRLLLRCRLRVTATYPTPNFERCGVTYPYSPRSPYRTAKQGTKLLMISYLYRRQCK